MRSGLIVRSLEASMRISACDKSSRSNCDVELLVSLFDLVPRTSVPSAEDS